MKFSQYNTLLLKNAMSDYILKRRYIISTIFMVFILAKTALAQKSPDAFLTYGLTQQDTIEDKQDLYNGIRWTNKYRNFDNHQFLFSDIFLNGKIIMNGKKYDNVRIKYDILSDEIITPVDLENIIQLNKEMVDSFSFIFENKPYRFINYKKDTMQKVAGYLQLLYEGTSALFVKYKKSISTSGNQNSDGNFTETQTIYLFINETFYQVRGKKSINRIFKEYKNQVNNFIARNKLKVSKKSPGSFIPVVQYLDSIRNSSITR